MMKHFLPAGFLLALVFSFRTDPVQEEAAMAAPYYDSIAYYDDGAPRYMRYLGMDSSVNQCWYTHEGRVAHWIVARRTWYSSYVHYAPDGRIIYDSTSMGWTTNVKRYDSSGYCHNFKQYYHGYGVLHPSLYSEEYILDANDNISNYITRDSLGRITGDYYYPLKYLDHVQRILKKNPDGKVEALGMGIKYDGVDTLVRTGIWQTYFPNGRIQTVGLYFNGVADGLHVAFDTIGIPVKWIYYSRGVPDADALSQFELDSIYFQQGQRTEQYWFFLRNGKEHRDGPWINISRGGYVSQFVCRYNGNSISGLTPRAPVPGYGGYYETGSTLLPVIMGGYQRLGIELDFTREGLIKSRKCSFFLEEEYCEDYGDKHVPGSRKTLNSYAAYSCQRKIFNAYMFPYPAAFNPKVPDDSCVMRNDTSWFYSGGQVRMKKIRGYGYQDISYSVAGNSGTWKDSTVADQRKDYVLLPNGKWFELKNTNLHPPGMWEQRVNGKITSRMFRTDMGYRGWWYRYSPKTGVKTSESYYENGKLRGRYRSWYDNGQLEETGKRNRHGEDKGVVKTYSSDGKLQSRYRAINGKMYGVAVRRNCGCLNLKRDRSKTCKDFYWNDKKIFRLNMVCRKSKHIPF